MRIIFRLVLLAAVAGLGYWLWTVFFPSPEKVIRARLTELARTASFGSGASPIARGLKAQRLANHFTPDAQLSFEAPGIGSRTLTGAEEIRQTAAAGFHSLSSLRIKFLDVTVQPDADPRTAEVRLTAEIRADGSEDYGVQELLFKFQRVDGKWLINRVETVRTLSRAATPRPS